MAPPVAEAGAGNPLTPCQDINGDGSSDVWDAVFFLSWRFLGGPEPTCPVNNSQDADLPDTGQTVCYGFVGDQGWVPVPCGQATCPGQDGAYATGCPSEGRFVDNGDGTVSDTCTGLMWQKDTADTDGDGQSTYQDAVPWCDALAYCENLSFAGHDDWRLPNVRELQSILDYGRFDPSIDPVFDSFSMAYWSSTTLASQAWLVFFSAGVSFGEGKVGSRCVRAVRSGSPQNAKAGGGNSLPPCQDINGDGSSDVSDVILFLSWRFLGGPQPTCPVNNSQHADLPDTGQTVCYGFVGDQGWVPVPCGQATCPGQDGAYATGCLSEGRFVDNGDGTVSDTCTGLMWQKDTADTDGDGQSTDQDYVLWCDALTYCENLSFAGHDDWRLPNVRELQSIVDYGRSPSIDPVFGSFSAAYWSSTSSAYDHGAALYAFFGGGFVHFSVGFVFGKGKVVGFHVRAVRSGL